MSMTARQLLQGTPHEIRKRSLNVKVTSIRRSTNEFGGLSFTANTATDHASDGTRIPTTDRTVYQTTVAVVDPKRRYVKLDCTCPSFPYWGWEYALNKKGAADIKRSNGQPPNVRNPTMRVSGCKHCTALLTTLIGKGQL